MLEEDIPHLTYKMGQVDQEHVASTQVALYWELATVRLESGPMFTRLLVNSHGYIFDHVTGCLIQEGIS